MTLLTDTPPLASLTNHQHVKLYRRLNPKAHSEEVQHIKIEILFSRCGHKMAAQVFEDNTQDTEDHLLFAGYK